MLHLICQQIWKTWQGQQDWKRSVFIPIPKKGNAKECSNYCTIELISHPSKVMLKILQARLQQYMNCELPDVQVGFRKGTRDQIANIHWIIEKAREFQKKTSAFALLTVLKPLTVWITANCEKFFKRWAYQTTWPASWEICMQIKKQQLELGRELPGTSVRNSAHGKGHEEGGLAYAKAWSSLRKPPVPQHLPPKSESVLCSHLHLRLYGGLSPITVSLGEGVNVQLQGNKNSWAWQECFSLWTPLKVI